MRKFILSVMMLIAVSAVAEIPTTMVVHTTNGNENYSIADICKLTFTNGFEITFNNTTNNRIFNYNNLLKVTFSELSGINDINPEEPKLRINYIPSTQSLQVFGDYPITLVQVFDIRGGLVASSNTADTEINLSLSDLVNGMYIVKAITEKSVETKKIVKR